MINDSMINPPIARLKGLTGDRYSLVVLTARRARQLIDGKAPLVDIDSKKPLTIAISELDNGHIEFDKVDQTTEEVLF